MVDQSRGEKLVVNLNISFPRVPCYRSPPAPSLLSAVPSPNTADESPPTHAVLSVDIMDISGEHQNDVHHDLFKTRISSGGKFIEEAIKGKELTGDVERVARQKAEGYCASLIPPRRSISSGLEAEGPSGRKPAH